VKQRGEATSSRFFPLLSTWLPGDGRGNHATAFINPHPGWRPEDKKDDEEKEEG
jgi:hypothetical protein